MLKSIVDDIKREFSYGNAITRIIIVNIIIFVVVNIVKIIMSITNAGVVSNNFLWQFCFSSDWVHNFTHPWTIITSIFLHEGFFHLLWNMLFLYWFGRIVGDFIGNQRVLPIFVMGGMVGLLFFFVSMQFPQYSGGITHYALGASGGVMAMVVAAGTLSPNYLMNLLLIGEVKLKYVVMVLVFLDLISISNLDNTGGHFAHIGGALFGWFFVYRLREGQDLSQPFNRFYGFLFDIYKKIMRSIKQEDPVENARTQASRSNSRSRARHVNDDDSEYYQDKLDKILDKIKQQGYDKLTTEEKQFLFKASNHE